MFLNYIEKYAVNENGIIKNTKTNQLYYGKPNSHGYLRLDISINGKRQIIYPHRAVAELFIPNPENKPQVNHINGIKTDNRVENLEWVTQKENTVHAVKIGLINAKTQRGKPCIQKDLKGNVINTFESVSVASRSLNINSGQICRVALGQRESTRGFYFEYLK